MCREVPSESKKCKSGRETCETSLYSFHITLTFKSHPGNSLVVQWLGLRTSPVGELRPHKMHGMAKNKIKVIQPF